MVAYVYEKYLSISAEPLTIAGAKVESALSRYKEEVKAKATYYTCGCTDAYPDLKIDSFQVHGEDYILEYPYDNLEELYSEAEQSQVGTDKKTIQVGRSKV